MDMITSKSNDTVKFIKSLNEKKYRKQHNAFYLEGVKVVSEVIEAYLNKAIDVKFIAYSYDILINVSGSDKIYEKLVYLENNYGLKTINLSSDVFKYTVDTVTPQGILAVISQEGSNSIEYDKINGNILILDSLQDAGNLGTIIRSADAFDVNTIICTQNTVDVYSPKVLRSTMGSILRVNIKHLDNYDFIEFSKKIKKDGYKIVPTSLGASKNITDLDFNEKYAFVFGNEANGVSKQILNLSDDMVIIPMDGSAESLNVSVAAGIILYEQYIKRK